MPGGVDGTQAWTEAFHRIIKVRQGSQGKEQDTAAHSTGKGPSHGPDRKEDSGLARLGKVEKATQTGGLS